VQIAEYERQVLHAKLALIDGIVFAGSANLDARSLDLNYEIMLRLADHTPAEGGREIFEADWSRSRRIRSQSWKNFGTWRRRLQGLAAAFLLTKIDPWLAHRQLRNLN
jgi:cardiolipin synthase